MQSINKIDKLVQDLSKEENKWGSLAIAIDLADEIMKCILGDNDKWVSKLENRNYNSIKLPEPFPIDIFKHKKQINWFHEHPGSKTAKVALQHFKENDCFLESRFYWFNDVATRQKISLATGFLTNWEDSNLTKQKDYNVGIDFFLTKDTNSLLLVVTNNHKIRVLELNEKLNNTQKLIFKNRLSDIIPKNKNNEIPQKIIHERLWDALQLKEVNKQFYNVVADYFNKLVFALYNDNNIDYQNAKQFSSRLIGRLLFIWFLRKKNLINESMNYFDADKLPASEYYENTLKKLFFNVLNTIVKERIIDDKDTPYLNGGLFEVHDNDFYDIYIQFPEDFFSDLYEKFNGFNFTTDESKADFELIAVDPEMLGHVFESLLASKFENEEKNERKETGSYYTPREIVSYMCKETVREYLYDNIKGESSKKGVDFLLDASDTEFLAKKSTSTSEIWGIKSKRIVPQIKKALKQFTAIDPACGSGAFPMGMMQLLLKIYERIDSNFNAYNCKIDIIKNNIYGVDVQPMAIEISRLRAWLSVIVEQNDKSNIEPLPNLDFKFICANTLIKLDSKNYNLFSDPELDKKLTNIRKKYFNARTPNSKHKYQLQYYELTREIDMFEDRRTTQLKSFDPFKNKYPASFFDSNYMFGIENGFDAVIGNPPYLLEGKSSKEIFKNIPYYQGKMDLWYSFACVGIDFLKNDGVLSFIAKNNWISNDGATKMRDKVLEDTKILKLLDFKEAKVFDSADIQTMILILKKDKENESYKFDYREIISSKEQSDNNKISGLLQYEKDSGYYLKPIFEKKKFKNRYFKFSEYDHVLNKINENVIYIGLDEIWQGLVLPQDFINNKHLSKLNGNFNKGEGIFVLNNEELQKMNLSEKEKELIKPYFTSNQVTRYKTDKKNKYWVIYTDSSFKNPDKMLDYPKIKRHLEQFSDIITSDNKPFGLHRSRKRYIFEGEKIIAIRKSTGRPKFSYNNFDSYLSQTFNVIKAKNIDSKYLLAILNSNVVAFWLKYKGKLQGDNFQLIRNQFQKFLLK